MLGESVIAHGLPIIVANTSEVLSEYIAHHKTESIILLKVLIHLEQVLIDGVVDNRSGFRVGGAHPEGALEVIESYDLTLIEFTGDEGVDERTPAD